MSFLLFVLYFVPILVALGRNTDALLAVIIINLAFGWTVIGWFVALIWAVTGRTKDDADLTRNAMRYLGGRRL